MESRQDGQNGILIGAWVAPAPYMKEYNNKDLITDKSYRILKESGINCIYAVSYTHLTLPTICSV